MEAWEASEMVMFRPFRHSSAHLKFCYVMLKMLKVQKFKVQKFKVQSYIKNVKKKTIRHRTAQHLLNKRY